MGDDRTYYLSKIERYLTELAASIQNNANRDPAFHVIYDRISCDLLNYIYDYQLTPANQALIMRGADLVDTQLSIAVQVTATNTRQKIDHILQIFSAGESGLRLCDSFHTLIILILSTKPLPRYTASVDTDFTLQVLNLQNLLTYIQRLPVQKLETIGDYLQAALSNTSANSLDRIIPSIGTALGDYLLSRELSENSRDHRDSPAPDSLPEPSVTLDLSLDQLSAPQCQVLRCAALLPKEGLHQDLFRQCLSEDHWQALLLLTGAGFLTRQGDLLHISPAFCRGVLKHLQPTRESCGEFLDRLLQYDRTYFWQHLHFLDRRNVHLQLAKTFGQAATVLPDPDGSLALRCAAFYSEVNETANALQWCLRAVQSCESAPNRDPWHLGNAYLRTAECYQQLNDNASSLKYCKKLLSLPKKDFSPADPDMARIYYQTGLAQVGLNDHTAALKSLSKAQGYSQNTMTVDHPLQSRISNMLSIANKATGNILEAREQKLQSLREFQSRPVTNSAALVHKLEQLEKVQAMPAILRGNKDETLYCEIGDLYHAQGDYVKALEYHLLAVKVREQRPETAPKKLADSYHSIGVIFSDLDDYSEALDYLLKAKAIREERSGIPTADQIRSYLDLGAVYSDLGMHQYALEELTSALVLQKKHLPPQDPELAETYTALGNVCRTLGQDQKALKHYHDAVIILEASSQDNRTELAAACMNLANAQIQLAQYGKALQHARRASDIYTAILPAGHPQRITARQTVAWLEDMAGDN